MKEAVTQSGTTTTTKFVLDGWDPALAGATGNANWNVLADVSNSGSLETRYLRGDVVDQLFAELAYNGSSYTNSWTLTDIRGSVRTVIDNSANVLDAVNYGAFGNILTSGAQAETNSADRGRYAWTGRELDVETGLQYNRARFYDSATGRWMSQDPLGFNAGDSNLYRYLNNRPTVETDPSGLQDAPPGGFRDLWPGVLPYKPVNPGFPPVPRPLPGRGTPQGGEGTGGTIYLGDPNLSQAIRDAIIKQQKQATEPSGNPNKDFITPSATIVEGPSLAGLIDPLAPDLGQTSAKFAINWNAPNLDGFIVQHIAQRAKIDCSANAAPSITPGQRITANYWEAWEVEKGNNASTVYEGFASTGYVRGGKTTSGMPLDVADDRFKVTLSSLMQSISSPVAPFGVSPKGTQGSIYTVGFAQFIPSTAANAAITKAIRLWKPGGAAGAGQLPSTNFQPIWWTDSGSWSHGWELEWDYTKSPGVPLFINKSWNQATPP